MIWIQLRGSIQLTLTNAENLALYYMGMLRAELGVAMTPTDPGPGEFVFVEIELKS